MRTDVAIVGLGAMGAAALYQLVRRGVRAVGIDRYDPPHSLSSSHGETRITRCAVGEGQELVPLVLRSHAIWRELEAEVGDTLLDACGFLMMAPRGVRAGHHSKKDYLKHTRAAAEAHGIGHEMLDTLALARRFPAFEVTSEEGYYEPGGGFVYPERCIRAQLDRARALGASIRTNTAVTRVEPDGNGVRIEVGSEVLLADRVVVAAGAWAADLLGPAFARLLTPRRQVLHWFPVVDEAPFQPGSCPSYIWMYGAGNEDYFYGFPAQPGSGLVKVASEQTVDPTHPDTVNRNVSPAERAAMFSTHVAGRLRGAEGGPGPSAVALYTNTPDKRFLIDRHPDSDRILAVSPCSGHGFKHSAAIGESVAELVTAGRSSIDISSFGLERLLAS